jgi:hypothetical protein
MHTTDWLPTLAGLAGASDAVAKSVLPLDGVDQWLTISKGAPTKRTFIMHNCPITAVPVWVPSTDRKTGKPSTAISTSACLSNVDNRTGLCHGFGLTGGALRMGDFKLLITNPGSSPWESSSPQGGESSIAQANPSQNSRAVHMLFLVRFIKFVGMACFCL